MRHTLLDRVQYYLIPVLLLLAVITQFIALLVRPEIPLSAVLISTGGMFGIAALWYFVADHDKNTF